MSESESKRSNPQGRIQKSEFKWANPKGQIQKSVSESTIIGSRTQVTRQKIEAE